MGLTKLKKYSLQLALLAGSFLAGTLWAPALAQNHLFSFYLGFLLEIHQLVRQSYIEKVPEDLLMKGAIRGLLQTLADPYTRYLDAAEFQELSQERTGLFEGLGLQVDQREGQWIVVSPIEDSSSWRAGIRAGDWLLTINDFPTQGLSLDELKQKMDGEPGALVSLSVYRPGTQETHHFEIQRTRFQVSAVKAEMKEGQIGYIRLTSFLNERVSADVEASLQSLKAQGMRSLLIDIRNNPGGLLSNVLDIADLFMDKGIIVRIVDRESLQTLKEAQPGHLLSPDLPMAVLIDQGSASASEVLAGALKDHKRATLIGTTTFGKGLVQTVHALADGSGFLLTTHRYLTAAGLDIDHVGIPPDIKVPGAGAATEEQQLLTALAYLRNRH